MRALDRTARLSEEDRNLVMTTLPASSVPATARMMLEQRFGLWPVDREKHGALLDDVLLCMSELVTNACKATRLAITFKAVFDRTGITISTWDPSNEMPKPSAAGGLGDITPDARALDDDYGDGAGGLGLSLVEALSSAYGAVPTDPRGKLVWAFFSF